MKIKWDKETKELDISRNDLTSLSQINFSLYPGVKILDVSFNYLTDLIGCPNSVTILNTSTNNLIDLIGCPNSLIYLNVFNNKLTTLKGCSSSITNLYIHYNELTTLEYFPNSVIYTWLNHNPLNAEWKNLTINQIKEKSLKIKEYKEMITISRIYGLWLLKNYEVFNIYTSNNINLPFELIKHIILFVC
jgi:Leucine-rich repeat (LRR) protein